VKSDNNQSKKKPSWLKVKAPLGKDYLKIKQTLAKNNLFTVCEEAACPNIGECWNGGTATFMLLGGVCTRGCKFCNVVTGNPNGWVDNDEPEKIAKAISEMDLNYIVLTSVDRDDLADHGSSHFAKTVDLCKKYSPNLLVETLTPDWQGIDENIKIMVDSKVDVLAHNIETVESLQLKVRDKRASYSQSMDVLRKYKDFSKAKKIFRLTKSSIMLGLGEKDHEIKQCMLDLRAADVDILTLGQYLRPSDRHLPVIEYVTPEKFSYWAKIGEQELGFKYVASGPLVRSSYRAGEYFVEKILRNKKSEGEVMTPKGV